MEMAIEDRDLLEEYFLERFPERITDEEAYHILLLVMGLKPGTLVMSADKSQRKLLEDFCKDSGLKIKLVEGGKRSLLDRLLGRDSRFRKDSIYLAREKERFSILEQSKGDFTGFTDEAVGRFLGYPESAVAFYSREEVPAKKFERFIQKKLDEDEITGEELGFLSLVGYLPNPEADGLEKALEEGRKRSRMLQSLDESLQVKVGKKYQEKIKN